MTEIISAPQAAESAGVSRRRIMQGAAWAAPAIVIATAAPALAASTTASVSSIVPTIWRSGNSDNFYMEIAAAVQGVSAGEIITIAATFGAGTSTVQVTDNSSGWQVATTGLSGTTFTFTATKAHVGGAALSVAKFKINANPASGVLSKPVALTFSVGGQTIGTGSAVFPAS